LYFKAFLEETDKMNIFDDLEIGILKHLFQIKQSSFINILKTAKSIEVKKKKKTTQIHEKNKKKKI
jgi:hypothetical protein